MRLIVTTLALAGALLTAAASSEQPAMTAGDLQQLCTGTDHVSRNACRIYILGVTQGIAVGMSLAEGRARGRACTPPPGISAETLEQTVKERLAADLASVPAHRDADAAGFIAKVLAAAFPCGKTQGPADAATH